MNLYGGHRADYNNTQIHFEVQTRAGSIVWRGLHRWNDATSTDISLVVGLSVMAQMGYDIEDLLVKAYNPQHEWGGPGMFPQSHHTALSFSEPDNWKAPIPAPLAPWWTSMPWNSPLQVHPMQRAAYFQPPMPRRGCPRTSNWWSGICYACT